MGCELGRYYMYIYSVGGEHGNETAEQEVRNEVTAETHTVSIIATVIPVAASPL